MVALSEETANVLADLPMRDLQALTPDMVLNEPEYWNRYELEIGEEGEGGHETSLYGVSPGWPHFDAYISPQMWNAAFSSSGQVRLAVRRCQHIAARGGAEIHNGGNLGDDSTQTNDPNIPLNELLRQWSTQSTIGDVLRDFHCIIAYVLDGMQKYEAGMAPWPRVSPGFDEREDNLGAEDVERNISISSASRRVLSLLESTGIPQTPRYESPVPRSAVLRVSKIPRLVKKDPKIEAFAGEHSVASENGALNFQEEMHQGDDCQDIEAAWKIGDIGRTTVSAKAGLITPGRRGGLLTKGGHLSGALNSSSMGDNERASSSRSPDKKGHSRSVDPGHTVSKTSVLLARPGGSNTPKIRTENTGLTPFAKGVENSPVSGQRSRLMAGEMQVPVNLYFRGRKPTRDDSPLSNNYIIKLVSPTKDNCFSDPEEEEEEDMSKDEKENHHPSA